MKITRLKDSVRNIKKKIVSWISIVIVIMMSVGCYLGCYFYRKSLSDMSENFYKKYNFKDLEIISSKGISQEEVENLKDIDGIKETEPFNLIKCSLVYKDKTNSVDFINWTEKVSVPEIKEGKIPEKEDEIAISNVMADKMKIKIGDTVDISIEGESAKLVKKRTFKVTALVDHPDYLKYRYANFVVAQDTAFDLKSSNGNYLRAIIKADYPSDVYPFSKEYFDTISPLEKKLEEMMDDMGKAHDADIKANAQSELDDKKTELDEELKKAEKKIEDGQKEYDDKLKEGREKLENARKELSGYDAEIEKKEKELREGMEKLAKAKALANSESDKAKAQIDEAYRLLEEGLTKINEMKQKVAEGENELAAAKSKLEAAKTEYDSKKQEAESGIQEAKTRLEEAISESQTARAEVEKFEVLLNQISASTGLAVPQQYYDLKEKSTEIYKPVEEAMVKQEDPTEARAAADAQMNVAVDEALYGGTAPLMPFIREMNVRDFLNFSIVYYGDITVLEVLDKADSLFVNGMPGSDIIRAFVEAVDPNMNITKFLEVLDVSAELVGIGDTKVGDLTEYGEGLIKDKMMKVGMAMASVDVLQQALNDLTAKIEEITKALEAASNEIAAAEKKISEGEKQISEGKSAIEVAVKKYEEGLKQAEDLDALLKQKTLEAQAELDKADKMIEDGRNQLADAKSKLSGYKSKLEEGEAEYEKQKNEGAKKLEDARAEYDKKKKEAEDKIAEAQDKIDNLEPTYFVLQSRRANEGYMDIYTVLGTIKAAANCFIIVFIIIGVLVCFSTITIIIDEQKHLVGTQKSLGFFNKVIRRKYMLYGVSAVITGIIIGILLNILLQVIFQKGIGLLYVVGVPKTIFMFIPTIGISIAEILVADIASFAACYTLLKMTAVELMSGQASLKRIRKKKARSKAGSTYSRLIRRNMVNDIVRVIISVVIIAASCAMIGAGFTLKYAFSGMVDNQLTEVYKYDMSVTYKVDEDEETVRKLEEAIADSGAVYSKTAYALTIYRAGDRKEYTGVTILNDMTHPKYYSVIDYNTGEEMELPDEGILIQSRLHELTGLDAGDTLIMYTSDFKPVNVEIKGVYNNYIGRNIVTSEEAYEKLNGKPAEKNTFFIKLNGVDGESLEKSLKAICPDITLTTSKTIKDSYHVLEMIYNMIVLILTGFAILMSIFVLSNLTNIFVSRRKKELIVMRVNGFSSKQCIGYLTRETIATTIIAFVLAVGVGIIMARIMISFIESEFTMYERGVSIKAWVYAIFMETAFAGIIDALSFRKVKSLKVTDINS